MLLMGQLSLERDRILSGIRETRAKLKAQRLQEQNAVYRVTYQNGTTDTALHNELTEAVIRGFEATEGGLMPVGTTVSVTRIR